MLAEHLTGKHNLSVQWIRKLREQFEMIVLLRMKIPVLCAASFAQSAI